MTRNGNLQNFLSVEGIDGSGKTLAVQTLQKVLEANGYEVLVTCDPAGTDLGKAVRPMMVSGACSKEAEMLLYMAARAELVNKVIIPGLTQGKIVISDRFFDSTYAYQGGGRELHALVDEFAPIGNLGVAPCFTILMDVDALTSNERVAIRKGIEPDSFDLAGDAFKNRVISTYRRRAEAEPERFVVIDAKCSMEDVISSITSWVNTQFPKKDQA